MENTFNLKKIMPIALGVVVFVLAFFATQHFLSSSEEDKALTEAVFVEKAAEIISAKQAIEAEGELNIGFLPSAKGKMLKDGYHKTYNENKDILMDGAFKSGKLWTGKHYIYDENGLLERIDVYKEGAFSGNGVL